MPRFIASTTKTMNRPITACQCWLTKLSSAGMPILKDDKISSSTSSATAPTTGPIKVPSPPSTTITISSPDTVQAMYEGATKRVRLASSTPASTHTWADST